MTPIDVAPNEVAPNEIAPNEIAPNEVAPNELLIMPGSVLTQMTGGEIQPC